MGLFEIRMGIGLVNEDDEKIVIEANEGDVPSGSVELQLMIVRASHENGSAPAMDTLTARRNGKLFFLSDMSSINSIHVYEELGLYATIFCFVIWWWLHTKERINFTWYSLTTSVQASRATNVDCACSLKYPREGLCCSNDFGGLVDSCEFLLWNVTLSL